MKEKIITIKMTESEYEALLDKLRFTRDVALDKIVHGIDIILVSLDKRAQD